MPERLMLAQALEAIKVAERASERAAEWGAATYVLVIVLIAGSIGLVVFFRWWTTYNDQQNAERRQLIADERVSRAETENKFLAALDKRDQEFREALDRRDQSLSKVTDAFDVLAKLIRDHHGVD